MKLKSLIVSLITPLIFLGACSSNNQDIKESTSSVSSETVSANENNAENKDIVIHGYIVSQNEDQVRVMQDITKEEIMGKNEEGLEAYLRENYADEGYNIELDKIDEATKSSLHVGQKVAATISAIFLSEPLSGSASKIEVIRE